MIDQPSTTGSEITQDDKNMAMLACVLGIITGFLGPLIIYLVKKDQSRYAAYYAMQILAMEIALIVAMIAVHFIPFMFLLAYPVFGILNLIMCIMATMAANKGDLYEIPLAGKFARQQVGL